MLQPIVWWINNLEAFRLFYIRECCKLNSTISSLDKFSFPYKMLSIVQCSFGNSHFIIYTAWNNDTSTRLVPHNHTLDCHSWVCYIDLTLSYYSGISVLSYLYLLSGRFQRHTILMVMVWCIGPFVRLFFWSSLECLVLRRSIPGLMLVGMILDGLLVH